MLGHKKTAPLLEQTEPHDLSVIHQSIPNSAPLHTDDEPTGDKSIIDDSPATVKQRISDLSSLRAVAGLTAKSMVEIVQELYPKYDKIIQSKCEHGDEYGIAIRKDAFDALLKRFAPEIVSKRKQDRNRNSNRIQARLSEEVIQRFRSALAEDGCTVQDWIVKQVNAYLEERGKSNDTDSR